MSLPDIILASVLFLILIGFFVVVWKAASNWRWFNIVAVVITMLLAITFLFPTAAVLKSRSAWHKVQEELELKLANLKVEKQELKFGELSEEDSSLSGGLVELQQQIAKLGIESGRLWRNLELKNNSTYTPVRILLGAAPSPANGVDGIPGAEPADGAVPAQPLVPPEMLVYCFAEQADKNQLLVPKFYLGAFQVKSSSPTEVVLVPTGNLEQYQLNYMKEGKARNWSLYELLPLDGHEPFLTSGSVALGSNPTADIDSWEVDDVSDLLDEAAKSIPGFVVPEQTRNNYVDDGRKATDDDPLLSRWTKVKFLKNHKIEVDSQDQRSALEGGFFDGNGRAVDARLQRGEDGNAEFKKDDTLVLIEEEAKKLIDEGVCIEEGRVYLRPLNDYGYVFRRIRLRVLALKDRMVELTREQEMLNQAIAKTDTMLVMNQEIKLKLEQDLTQYRIESKAIRDHTEKLVQQVKEMRAEMNRLEQENTELEQSLEQKHLTIERQLDALTATP